MRTTKKAKTPYNSKKTEPYSNQSDDTQNSQN